MMPVSEGELREKLRIGPRHILHIGLAQYGNVLWLVQAGEDRGSLARPRSVSRRCFVRLHYLFPSRCQRRQGNILPSSSTSGPFCSPVSPDGGDAFVPSAELFVWHPSMRMFRFFLSNSHDLKAQLLRK